MAFSLWCCSVPMIWNFNDTHSTNGERRSYMYSVCGEAALCSLRVPTWSPFRLQFYCNGHSVLARQMSQRNIEYRVLDNAFGWIADFETAQQLADEFRVERLHR